MRFLAAILFCASVLGSLPTASRADSGAREMLGPSAQDDWLAVGRLNVSGQGFCTATLIAPDLALTAAHCLLDRRTGRRVRAERVHFLPGFRIGKYAAHGRARGISVLPGYSRETRSIARDVGLVRLRRPVGGKVTPITPGGPVVPGDVLTTLSYGIDRSEIASLETGCRVERIKGVVLYTSCDGVAGVSGAPLIRITPDGPRVVAVASAVIGAPGPVVRGKLLAVALSDEILTLLKDDLDIAEALLTKM